jgi:aerobic-type carbon monoxide dehydrogenase small subunit (CoxS/CutS family)
VAVSFVVNGQSRTVDVSPQMPLSWVLRNILGLYGTNIDRMLQSGSSH